MLAIYAGAIWIPSIIGSSNDDCDQIAILGRRFVLAAPHLMKYILMRVLILAEATGIEGFTSAVATALGTKGVPPEVASAISGRVVSNTPDAGWLVLYKDVGWWGCAAMLWISVYALGWGVAAYMSERSAASVFALMILCYCLMIGFFMRFQMFPVWIFICVALIPCLAFWSRVASSNPRLPTSGVGKHCG